MDKAVLLAKVQFLMTEEGLDFEDALKAVVREEETRPRSYREIRERVQRDLNEAAHEHQGNLTIP